MPDDTWAKPDVGSDAGQPITKLAALNGVCWPTRISPAFTSPSTTAASTAGGDGHLEVLGGEAVGDGDRLVEVGGERRTPPLAPSDARAASARRSGSAASCGAQLGVDGGDEGGVGRHEHDRRVGAVLGLDQQVGGQAHRVGGAVGDDQRSRSARAASSWRRRGAASRPGRS